MSKEGNTAASVSAIDKTELSLIPPADFADELRSLTLDELLGSVNQVQRLMEYPDDAFDPKSIVGELILNPDANEEMRAAIRKKVDSLYYVISEFEAYGHREKIRADRYAKRSQLARNRAERIREQVKFVMDANGFQKLAGNDYVAKKTENTFANCSLVFDREPDAADMIQFDFVEEIPAVYVWKNKEVKDALKAFYKALKGQPDCGTCKGKKKVILVDALVPCHDCCGTGVVIPNDVDVPLAHSVAYLEWNPKLVFDDIDRPEVSEKKPRKKKGAK